jgi:hypothetical protein
LIFDYHKLSGIFKLSLVVFFASVGFGSTPDALSMNALPVARNLQESPDQSFLKQIDHFLQQLVKASREESSRVFGKYRTVIAAEVDYEKLYVVSYTEVADLLSQAAKESIDALTLFTLPILQKQNGVAIVFDEELLRRVNKNFNFHGLFSISIPAEEIDATVKMKFLIIGQGKFIVGYDRNAKIKHPDYGFATGYYDYRELFIMDAGKDSQGNPGLFNIKSLSAPDGKRQSMKGPLNVDVRSLTLIAASDRQRKILIHYELFGIKQKIIDPIPIEKLSNG